MIRHAPEFIAIMYKLLPLLRQHQPFCVMPFPDLCDHLAYFWNRGTMCYILSDYGEPRAVCLIKFFRQIEQFMDTYVHEPVGEFCQIELMVSEDPLAMGQIFEEFTEHWGTCKTMLWDRGERTENGAPRIYKWKQFEKLARRLTYGVIGENVYGK